MKSTTFKQLSAASIELSRQVKMVVASEHIITKLVNQVTCLVDLIEAEEKAETEFKLTKPVAEHRDIFKDPSDGDRFKVSINSRMCTRIIKYGTEEGMWCVYDRNKKIMNALYGINGKPIYGPESESYNIVSDIVRAEDIKPKNKKHRFADVRVFQNVDMNGYWVFNRKINNKEVIKKMKDKDVRIGEEYWDKVDVVKIKPNLLHSVYSLSELVEVCKFLNARVIEVTNEKEKLRILRLIPLG